MVNGNAQGYKCVSSYFTGHNSVVCPHNSTDISIHTDYRNLEVILKDLRHAASVRKTMGNPFFVSYGIHRPHLPFHFPTSFNGTNIWDAYGADESIAVPAHNIAPKGMPGIAFTYEMDGQTHITVFGDSYPIPGPNNDNSPTPCPFCGPPLPDNATRIMRKGYYSAVSWIDYLVGLVMEELDALGQTPDTVIALVGVSGLTFRRRAQTHAPSGLYPSICAYQHDQDHGEWVATAPTDQIMDIII